MKPQQNTTAIVLTRVDYGEADRIITLLTPDAGKLRLIAKGVRRIKSKLAGGIELFSVSHITYIHGRGEIGTLVSTRLMSYYSNIVQDIDRTMLGYELIKQLSKATEDEPESDYFQLLEQGFAALDDEAIPLDLIRTWFMAQLLRLSGHTPNLTSELNGYKLAKKMEYDFNFDDSAFKPREGGEYGTDTIKFLRLIFAGNIPKTLAQVHGYSDLLPSSAVLVRTMLQTHVRTQ